MAKTTINLKYIKLNILTLIFEKYEINSNSWSENLKETYASYVECSKILNKTNLTFEEKELIYKSQMFYADLMKEALVKSNLINFKI